MSFFAGWNYRFDIRAGDDRELGCTADTSNKADWADLGMGGTGSTRKSTGGGGIEEKKMLESAETKINLWDSCSM